MREMRERLREIAEEFTGSWINLLGVQPKIIGQGLKMLEQLPRLFRPPAY